ncbi:hypothetical protein LV779_27085 [Streptomyces thinghirensis]|nr:hypothetical protein [Streptomyces thinghirensis]
METTAWTQLHSVMNAELERRPLARATLRRIGAFARPHAPHRRFILLGVGRRRCSPIATPVLANHVVNAIVSGDDEARSSASPC